MWLSSAQLSALKNIGDVYNRIPYEVKTHTLTSLIGKNLVSLRVVNNHVEIKRTTAGKELANWIPSNYYDHLREVAGIRRKYI